MKNTEASSPERVYQYALKLLAARDYTSSKLSTKLGARSFAEADVETAVRRLTDEGWLNDRRFAERFAESSLASGRFVGPRLRLEMRRRGVPAGLIDDVFGQMQGEHDEWEGAASVLERRYPGFSFKTADDREKRRVLSFLQRRGFGFSAIMRAMRAELTE